MKTVNPETEASRIAMECARAICARHGWPASLHADIALIIAEQPHLVELLRCFELSRDLVQRLDDMPKRIDVPNRTPVGEALAKLDQPNEKIA